MNTHGKGAFALLVASLVATSAPGAKDRSENGLDELGAIGALGIEAADLRLDRDTTDALGLRHIRIQEVRHGLEVVGGTRIVHLDHTGKSYLISGPAEFVDVDPVPSVPASLALILALGNPAFAGLAPGPARLVYVVSGRDRALHLAWESLFTGQRDGDPVSDRVYVDAHDGSIADVHPQIQMALNRLSYSARNGTPLPGALLRSEGEPAVADGVINAMHDSTGTMYDCFMDLFNRDSFDNAGAALKSTAHYSTGYANAFWNSTQVVYGDGNGREVGPLASDPDVVVHEWTHAITEHEAALVFSGESGGLNETTSDIFAAVCDWHRRGRTVATDTWRIGEVAFVGGLRYMDDPARDGDSLDYYQGGAGGYSPSYSSGIVNLAFYLLVSGGHHPRGKSTVEVTGIGMERAAQLWYRALTTYLTPNASMSDARQAMLQAAQDFGSTDADAVMNAFAAVGIGSPAATDTTPPSLNLPASINAEATGTAGAAVSYTATASDNVDPNPTVDCMPPPGSVFALGTTAVSCSASDSAGNSSTGSFSVTVVDTTPPAVAVPAPITVHALVPADGAVTFSASATDSVDPNPSWSCSSASGTVFPLGITTVSCSATDAAGNVGSNSFSVQIIDSAAPALGIPSNISLAATGPGGAAVSYSASASDSFDANPAVSCSPASGSTFVIGTTTVACTATDASGNGASASFRVTVFDTTPPTLTVPADITVPADDKHVGAVVSFTVTAADIEDPSPTVSCSPASASLFLLGTTTVKCSASDDSGNHVVKSFTVTVVKKDKSKS